MANELDEMTGPVNGAGRDINVIEKQIPVKVGVGSTIFEILLWVCFIIPGLIFLFMKINAKAYFNKLQQMIQADASRIDNYLEQRVQILQNVARLVDKAIDLDKDVMKAVAAFRGGRLTDGERNAVANQIDGCFGRLFPQVEAYPDLKAHLEEEGRDVQKIMLFARDPAVRDRILADIQTHFDDLAVSTSTFNNLEINAALKS